MSNTIDKFLKKTTAQSDSGIGDLESYIDEIDHLFNKLGILTEEALPIAQGLSQEVYELLDTFNSSLAELYASTTPMKEKIEVLYPGQGHPEFDENPYVAPEIDQFINE